CVCVSCDSWTYLPRPGGATQAALHDTEDYFDHPYFARRRGITPAQRQRCRRVFRRLSAAVGVGSLRGQRLLDIGCDTGGFLQAGRELVGIIPVGVDVAQRAVRVARGEGLEVYPCTIEDAPAELTDFAIVTAIDLIEHVPNPHDFLVEV